ncbi:MAG: hypothetical protein AABX01_03030 [Candidatus Micrarchaeota archaeon]
MKDKDHDMDVEYGWWGRCRRFGFGFWLGIFILIWGLFEIGREFGIIKFGNFPFWPLILVFIGISMISHRI